VLKLILFCKSYRGDLLRFQRLWGSIQKHNVEQIPFYASVPAEDLSLFRQEISNSQEIHWLTDEEIVEVSPGGSINRYQAMDGRLSQQIIKAEAWRKIGCENYVCFDSDCEIMRDVFYADFLNEDDVPYTVMHQHKCFLEHSFRLSKLMHYQNFLRESEQIKEYFLRHGPDYEFGPMPCIWSSKVWTDLADKSFSARKINLWDAVELIPIEIRWYGEALLKHRSIPINPVEPLMKAYLYYWQYKRSKIDLKYLNKIYVGVVFQSNWQYELGFAGSSKSIGSRLIRRLKRWVA
jgi:hypothetical protein